MSVEISNEELVREVIDRGHCGIFVGKGSPTDAPTIHWNTPGDLYSTFYLFKFLNSIVFQKYRLDKSLTTDRPPAKNESNQEMEPDGLDVSDLELVDTDLLINHLCWRYPTVAIVYVKPDRTGKRLLRRAFWQGPCFELMGLIAFAAELFEESAMKNAAVNCRHDDPITGFDTASLKLAGWIANDKMKIRSSGLAVQISGFAQYLAAQTYKNFTEAVQGVPLDRCGNYDFDS